MSVSIGDVLLTRNKRGWPARLIRLGAALRDQPNLQNHVAVLHHIDNNGTPWAVEGRPGGVGWVDATRYLRDPWTVSNWQQPRTDTQRVQVAEVVEGMLHVQYDWTAIVADAADAIGMPALFAEKWDGQTPAHVVCSSLARWAYEHVGLPHPTTHDGPRTTPADWTAFILERGWWQR